MSRQLFESGAAVSELTTRLRHLEARVALLEATLARVGTDAPPTPAASSPARPGPG